jgi:hypothetical protein
MAKLRGMKHCKGKKRGGVACQVAALPGSEFCFFHDPARAAERWAAQAQGGRQNRAKTLDASTPDLKITDARGVVRLVSETINQVRKGAIDTRVGTTVGYLAGVLVKALEQADLEQRIESLEALIKARRHEPDLVLALPMRYE